MRIVLIRHCKTVFNTSGRIMGWSDSPHVEDWLDDVQYIEHQLKVRHQIPDLVYTSALGRARHTGDYLAQQFDRSAQHSQQLNEVNYGSLANKSKKWVAARYPLHKNDPGFVYPEGESFSDMQDRAVRYVTGLGSEHGGQTLLCVAHAGVIRALVSHFLNLDFAAQLKRRIPHRYIGVISLQGPACHHYEEWGEPSGFVLDGVISLPWRSAPSVAATDNLSA